MTTKTFEVRDRATFIPVLAIQLEPADDRERWLLARAGFGRFPIEQSEYIILIRLSDSEAHWDAFLWTNRTMRETHRYLLKVSPELGKLNFEALKNGAVIDVEFILGESQQPKVSEQETIGG